MKGLLIDKNKFAINKDTIGSTIDFSCEYSNRKIPHNDFIDFF